MAQWICHPCLAKTTLMLVLVAPSLPAARAACPLRAMLRVQHPRVDVSRPCRQHIGSWLTGSLALLSPGAALEPADEPPPIGWLAGYHPSPSMRWPPSRHSLTAFKSAGSNAWLDHGEDVASKQPSCQSSRPSPFVRHAVAPIRQTAQRPVLLSCSVPRP